MNFLIEKTSFIYRAPAMAHVIAIARQAAAVDVTVLLTGESGVGKEELANFIWKQSAQRPSVCEGKLRGDSGDADGVRAVRL